MKERPILFSGPMVRAILDGSKTQTRRVVKPVRRYEHNNICRPDLVEDPYAVWWHGVSENVGCFQICPYGTPGDRLFPAMPIPSLNRNYCADLHGRIWSRAKDRETWNVLKGSVTSKGYLSVTPAHEGRYRTRLVHRLVAEAFYGREPEGLNQVRHLNGDQKDNAPENLDWGTQEDNWSDRLVHGRDTGERHHAAKLTAETVEKIRAAEMPQRAVAARFGVAQSTVWAIRTGRYWQHAPKQNPPNCQRWASCAIPEITDVRVQRLQEISEEDARAEGVSDGGCLSCGNPEPCGCGNPQPDARDGFAWLWQSIHGSDGWHANPWVWAITFQRLEP